MSNAPIAYPFDPSGTLASNKIVAEHQVISPPELSEFHFIVPEAAPFFAGTSLVVVHLPSARTLVEGVDYMPTHYFHDASLACAKPIYGSITFFDHLLSGAVRLSYQSLGGDWVLSPSKIVELLSNKLINPRRTTWEMVAELPYAFPPIDHDWHLDDMVGMAEMVAVLQGMRDDMAAAGESGLLTHIADKTNPHQVNKAQVGLDNVANYPVATQAAAEAGVANNVYLTPLRTAQLLQALIGNALTAHIAQSDNPHNVTPSQLGLGNVENYTLATQAEAEAGALTSRYMTPLRTAQAINAMIGNVLTNHITRQDNPHQVNKVQIGLGSVQNYAVADAVAARSGTATNLYMTPAMTREAINTIALQGVVDHIDNRSNPHNVTKTQLGLEDVVNYPMASQAEAETGQVNDRYMTPLRTAQAISTLVTTSISSHVDNHTNPHGVTKAQVGLDNVDNYLTATQAEAVEALVNNRFMTPLRTSQVVQELVGADFKILAERTDNPHNVTADQVQLGDVSNYAVATQAEAVEAVLNSRYMTPLRTAQAIQILALTPLNTHINRTDNPHSVTKAQVSLGNVDDYATASNIEAAAGLSTSVFMTPAGTKILIEALGGGSGSSEGLSEHLADFLNPHGVSKSQVGLGSVDNYATASTTEALEGTATDRFLTPAGSSMLVLQLVGNAFAQHQSAQNNPHQVTAVQVGAYSTTETDGLLDTKLSLDEPAADAQALNGHSYEDLIGNARSVEHYPPVNLGISDTWTLLGQLVLADNATDVQDIVGDATGGESNAYRVASTFRIRLTLRDLAACSVTVLTENYTSEVQFGIVDEIGTGQHTVKLYLRGPYHRHGVNVAAISQNEKFFIHTDTVLESEPAGITYLSIQLPPFTRERSTFGDLPFGSLPNTQNAEQLSGGLVQWVSVVDNDSDELTVQALATNLRDDYNDFLPASPAGGKYLYDDLVVLDAWGWDETEEAILLDTTSVPSIATLQALEYSLNYDFEVEVSSTDTAALGAGVLAALVDVGNRPTAISVVRTPGGLAAVAGVPSSFAYKLSNVALHIGQDDGYDIGGSNGAFNWADTNASDDGRDPTTFVPAGHGWDTAGKVRFKVNRTANLLTIDISQFGSTEYETSERLVIDLATEPRLQAFVDTPSTWGLISVKQPMVSFKVLNRPSQYRDYVRLYAAESRDKQLHYRYNGGTWSMSYLGINNPLVRPNRLYFSDWNGVLYQSQRNGRLRPILVEAYSRANPTVLTT